MPAPRVLKDVASALKTRAAETTTSSSTLPSDGSLLRGQWTNPSDVLSVLMIIGGDIVQKALAETSGGLFTPVCFSFGWVAYSFSALVNLLGDGRLLPEPDYPVKVWNLGNGYVRDNKHWVIGRIGRDHEGKMTKEFPLGGNALRIGVFEAARCTTGTSVSGSGKARLFSIVTMVLQFGIAAIPVGIWGEWGVMMITAAGTLGALAAGALPQWRAEKLPSRRDSKKNFAISSGNGSRDIMIILGRGNSLDLEELAVQESPRSTRIWEKIDFLSTQVNNADGTPQFHGNGVPVRKTKMLFGIPLGFIMTGALCTIQSVFWIALLITVAGLKSHSWFILAVGALGMFQNAAVAAISRDSAKRNLPLIPIDQITCRTVMDGLMDLEVTFPGLAPVLIEEFFPGELREDEKDWWKDRKKKYDDKRCADSKRRGIPRSRLPKYQNSNNLQTNEDHREDDHESDGPLLKPDIETADQARVQPQSAAVQVAAPLTVPMEKTTSVPRTLRPPEPIDSSIASEKIDTSAPQADSPVSPKHSTSTHTSSRPSSTSIKAPPSLPHSVSDTGARTKPLSSSPKKAKGPVHFAEDTPSTSVKTEVHDFAENENDTETFKAPTRSMTQPAKASPREENRTSASLSVDEIYKITHAPDWS